MEIITRLQLYVLLIHYNCFQGAGDAFLGSFAYFAANYPNLSMEEKVKRACYVASQSVLKKGTQSSFPYKKDLPAELFTH